MGSMEQMNNIQGLNTFNDDNNNTRVINIDSFPVYSSDTKYSAMNTFTSDANTNLQACQKHKTSCSSSDNTNDILSGCGAYSLNQNNHVSQINYLMNNKGIGDQEYLNHGDGDTNYDTKSPSQ